jgi:hypothetical protein
MEVNAMLMVGGDYSENVAMFKSSDLYADLTVGGTTTSKSSFASATAKWFTQHVMISLIKRVGRKNADKTRQLASKATDLNNRRGL